jgi:hypothetical protein
MKKFILIALTFASFSTFIACHKHDEATSAEITIMEPTLNDTILNGSELHVEGTIVGSGELHGYSISITNVANDSVFYTISSATHNSSYAFHEHWMNNVNDTTVMKVTIDAMLDHDGAKTSKTVNVICLP